MRLILMIILVLVSSCAKFTTKKDYRNMKNINLAITKADFSQAIDYVKRNNSDPVRVVYAYGKGYEDISKNKLISQISNIERNYKELKKTCLGRNPGQCTKRKKLRNFNEAKFLTFQTLDHLKERLIGELEEPYQLARRARDIEERSLANEKQRKKREYRNSSEWLEEKICVQNRALKAEEKALAEEKEKEKISGVQDLSRKRSLGGWIFERRKLIKKWKSDYRQKAKKNFQLSKCK